MLGTLLVLVSVMTPNQSDAIRVCQVGYLPDETKFAMLVGKAAGPVEVREVGSNSKVTVLQVGKAALDPSTGDEVSLIDFSTLKRPGKYFIEIAGVGRSHPFEIGKGAFSRAYRLALRSFYGQRCGMDVDMSPDFPEYKYKACHLDDAVYHASSGKTGTKKCLGGWHDAGDYGRYIVNSGITTATLLWTSELYGSKINKLKLDIPDSKPGVPDILTEVKWNLDWMLTMQDDDGGVWHKLTTANFPGFIMPAEDKQPSYIIGIGTAPFKNTTATADIAATCAIAGRVYKQFDKAYADKCLAAAKRAWNWAIANPTVRYQRNPQGIATGGYGDDNPSDEILWAAAELFRTTGEKVYNDYFLANYSRWKPTVNGDKPQGWPEVNNLAMYTYALSNRKETDKTAVATIKADSIKAADGIVKKSQANGYRIPLKPDEYYWGSNSVVANYAMMLQIASRFQAKPAYRDSALDMIHYIMGRNTFNTSYVTRVGTKWAMRPHHRPSAADKIDQPWPGLIVGGPNSDRKTTPPPARHWNDEEGSYTTNENAINWNAPLVFILAGTLP